MGLSVQQRYYLQTLGIAVYVPKDSIETVEIPDPVAREQMSPAAVVHQFDQNIWEDLQQQVKACVKCDLHKTRTQTVFGVGNVQADWLIIGEAPGQDEDLQGEPFVGRAGKLLNSMLRAIGLQREQVYIANIMKCRPPNNRDPRPEEVACCEGYLQQQIKMIKPKIILAVGRIAAHNLLKVDTPIGQMRGKRYEYPHGNVPVVLTYHPAYLLRSPKEKRKAWQDLQYAKKIYQEIS